MARQTGVEAAWSRVRKTDPAQIQERNRQVALHVGLARKKAHYWKEQCAIDYADLEQIAILGLIKAVERFDSSTGVAFSSFAVPYINGEILHFLRNLGTLIKIPRRWREKRAAAKKAERELKRKLDRNPTEEEVSAAIGLDVATLRQIIHAIDHQKHLSTSDHEECTLQLSEGGAELQDEGRLESVWHQVRERYRELSPRQEGLVRSLYFERKPRQNPEDCNYRMQVVTAMLAGVQKPRRKKGWSPFEFEQPSLFELLG